MSKDSDHCEFWLPPRFFDDDDDNVRPGVRDNNNTLPSYYHFNASHQNGFYGSQSKPIRSPVDRKSSISRLQDSGLTYRNKKDMGLCVSPKTNYFSEIAVNPLYPAFSQMTLKDRRMKSGADWYAHGLEPGLVRHAMQPEPVSVFHGPCSHQEKSLMFCPQLNALQKNQHENLKKQQRMKQETSGLWTQTTSQDWRQQLHEDRTCIAAEQRRRTMIAPSCPPVKCHRQHPQPSGSGMKAVILGKSVPNKGCAGTGVFLPKTCGGPPKRQNDQGRSTVFSPDDVVHSLNVNAIDDSLGSREPICPTYKQKHGICTKYGEFHRQGGRLRLGLNGQ